MCQDPFNEFAQYNPLCKKADTEMKHLLEEKYRKIRNNNDKYLPKHINRVLSSKFLSKTLRRICYLSQLNALGKDARNYALNDFCMSKRFASTDIKPYYDTIPVTKLPLKFVEWFCEKTFITDENIGESIARTTLGEVLSYLEEIKYVYFSQAMYRTNAKDVNFNASLIVIMNDYILHH